MLGLTQVALLGLLLKVQMGVLCLSVCLYVGLISANLFDL